MFIEKAKQDDLREILDLQYLAYQSEAVLFQDQDIPPLKQTLTEVIREYQNGTILKATDENGTIIGSVRAHMEKDTVCIGKLFVHPKKQGQGIGTKLLFEIEKEYPEQRYELFTSTRSLRNLELYQRLGYVIFKTEKITEEMEFVYLEKAPNNDFMKLTILVDNNTYIDIYYYGEPAVSYYIETKGERILFDTGYSDVLLWNVEKMGINLKHLTHVVLSHGHNDHSNGLRFLIEEMEITEAKLIAHPDCFLPKYDGNEYIGAPYSSDEIQHKIKYCPCKTPYNITENLFFLGEIPRINDFENKKPVGKVKANGEWMDDYVKDDTALVYKSSNGIFIITGCSHSGICNIVEYAKAVCKEERILGILGGFHLFEDDEQLEKTMEYLQSCDIEHIYPCHCVSLVSRAKMMEHLSVVETGVGMTVLI